MTPITLQIHNIRNAGFRVDFQADSEDIESTCFLVVQHRTLKNELKTMKGPELEPLLAEAERYATNYAAFLETAAACHHVHKS